MAVIKVAWSRVRCLFPPVWVVWFQISMPLSLQNASSVAERKTGDGKMPVPRRKTSFVG